MSREQSKNAEASASQLALVADLAVEVVGPWNSPTGQPSLVGRKGVTRGGGFCYARTIAVLLDEEYLTEEQLLPGEKGGSWRMRMVFLDPRSLRLI